MEIVTKSGNFPLDPNRSSIRLPCQMNRKVGDDFVIVWSQIAPKAKPVLANDGKSYSEKIRIEKIPGDLGEIMIVKDAKVGDVYQCQVIYEKVTYTIVDESDANAETVDGEPNSASSLTAAFSFIAAFLLMMISL